MCIYTTDIYQLAVTLSEIDDLKKILNPNPSYKQQIIESTSFLPHGSAFRQRLWYILNNTVNTPLCRICNQHPTKWDGVAKTYRIYCSSKCAHQDPLVLQKTVDTCTKKYGGLSERSNTALQKSKKTNLEKRGVEYTFQDPTIHEKGIQTLLNRYGVDHNTKIPGWLDKLHETSKQKYEGYEYPTQHPKVKQKQQKTMLERHGKIHSWSKNSNEIRTCELTMLKKYGVRYSSQVSESNNKRKQTCKERYGVDHPWKSEKVQEQIKSTNIKKYGFENPKQKHWEHTILENLTDYNWLYEQHVIQKKSLTEIAKEMNVSLSVVSKYAKKINLEIQFNNQLEHQLQTFLINNKCELIKHDRKKIHPHELDILIPKNNLAIEINGLYWHSQLNNYLRNYHLNKTKKCEEQGIRLIHIFENEWIMKQEIVKSRLKSILGLNKTIYGRSCTITENLPKTQIKSFLKNNHLQGFLSSKINIGLIFENELIALMSFSKSRNKSNAEWELTRYCSKTNTNIIGGANKCFLHFLKTYNPTSIVSYSDKRWNTGKLYNILGFTYSHTSNPNYWYFKNNDYTLYSRIKFQKHKLAHLLTNFNPKLSEWQNMINNGYNRIWDCGNDIWIWNR